MTKAIIFLDLTEMDKNVLRYVQHMDEKLNLTEVCLLHYVELQDLTEDYASHFPGMDRPLEDILHDEIEDKAIEGGVNKANYSIKVHAHGGQDDLLDWIEKSDYDLCVFGKKVLHRGTGVFVSKIARLVDKSILFVTETARHSLDKLLVPVDFSPYSRRTLAFADKWAKEIKSELIALHVYHVPPTYFPFVKAKTDDMVEEVRERSSKELEKFCDKNASCDSLRVELAHTGENTIAKTIYDYARSEHIDLILLGIKGRTNDDSLLIGSVAERLIQSDRDLPVLLVK